MEMILMMSWLRGAMAPDAPIVEAIFTRTRKTFFRRTEKKQLPINLPRARRRQNKCERDEKPGKALHPVFFLLAYPSARSWGWENVRYDICAVLTLWIPSRRMFSCGGSRMTQLHNSFLWKSPRLTPNRNCYRFSFAQLSKLSSKQTFCVAIISNMNDTPFFPWEAQQTVPSWQRRKSSWSYVERETSARNFLFHFSSLFRRRFWRRNFCDGLCLIVKEMFFCSWRSLYGFALSTVACLRIFSLTVFFFSWTKLERSHKNVGFLISLHSL